MGEVPLYAVKGEEDSIAGREIEQESTGVPRVQKNTT